jgi:hypothetical protein
LPQERKRVNSTPPAPAASFIEDACNATIIFLSWIHIPILITITIVAIDAPPLPGLAGGGGNNSNNNNNNNKYGNNKPPIATSFSAEPSHFPSPSDDESSSEDLLYVPMAVSQPAPIDDYDDDDDDDITFEQQQQQPQAPNDADVAPITPPGTPPLPEQVNASQPRGELRRMISGDSIVELQPLSDSEDE